MAVRPADEQRRRHGPMNGPLPTPGNAPRVSPLPYPHEDPGSAPSRGGGDGAAAAYQAAAAPVTLPEPTAQGGCYWAPYWPFALIAAVTAAIVYGGAPTGANPRGRLSEG